MAVEKDQFFDVTESMSQQERENYFQLGLRQTVKHAYRHSSAVRKLLDSAGVEPSQMCAVKDLEKIPVTRKTDLIEMQKSDPPFGGLLAMPAEDIERIFISPGPVYEYQPSKIKWFARSFWAAGFRKGDVVVNTFTYHMSPAGTLFHEGLRDCGASVVVMGTGNTDSLIKAMLDLKVTGFVGTPSFLMIVIKRAEEMGLGIQKDFELRVAWFTGEMLSPSIRKCLESEYGLATFQAYAVTEPGGAIAYECREKDGMHLMDEYIVEIVDPQTGKQMIPGEVGEIVVTPIHNRSWGLLRFGTGDMASMIVSPCPCGRTSFRISGLVGRTGDAVKVRGMFVVARQAEQALAGIPQISKFQLVVSRRENRDQIVLRTELRVDSGDRTELSETMNKSFQDACRLKLDSIEFVDPGSIPDPQKTIVDERKWE
jgi:phenylacetate-CoA ligase